jgi:hypothetical protein
MRNKYKILVREAEGQKPLRRPRSRWEDNIKKNPRKHCIWVWTESVVGSYEHSNEVLVPINREKCVNLQKIYYYLLNMDTVP